MANQHEGKVDGSQSCPAGASVAVKLHLEYFGNVGLEMWACLSNLWVLAMEVLWVYGRFKA